MKGYINFKGGWVVAAGDAQTPEKSQQEEREALSRFMKWERRGTRLRV